MDGPAIVGRCSHPPTKWAALQQIRPTRAARELRVRGMRATVASTPADGVVTTGLEDVFDMRAGELLRMLISRAAAPEEFAVAAPRDADKTIRDPQAQG